MARNFSNWLDAYCEYTQHTEAPIRFHLWTGIWAVASMLQRNVTIDMGHFEWVPNFYIVLVSPAGVVNKSTSIGIGEDLLRYTGRAKFGSNSSTWQALINEMRNTQKGKIDYEDMDTPIDMTSAMTLGLSELGSFLDLEDRAQVDFMTDIWDAKKGPWKRTTVGGGETAIQNPVLNVIAGTTPNWIKQNFKQSMVGGGFSSRLIMVQAKKKRRAIAYPSLQGGSADLKLRQGLIDDLKRINDLKGNMQLTPEAIEWGTDWYNKHVNSPELRRLQGEQFEGYYARKQTHMHKVAIVLAAATSDRLIITDQHLIAANGILIEMERDLGEIFEYVRAQGIYSQTKMEILRIMRERKRISKTNLYKEMATLLSSQDFERMIADLLKAKEIGQLQTGTDFTLIYKGEAPNLSDSSG